MGPNITEVVSSADRGGKQNNEGNPTPLRVADSYASPAGHARDTLKEPDESEQVILEVSVSSVGYTGGGTQLREAVAK